jgi:Uma2 family endonuclease
MAMSFARTKQQMAEAEYLALEEGSEQRHEWFDGEVFAMAGGSDRHNLLGVNLLVALRSRTLGGPCVPFGSDRRHRVVDMLSYTYPDVVVRCRDPQRPELPPQVRVIFEVLSESTEAFDRGDKFARYRTDPDLLEYVLVSQRARRVEHFRRVAADRWELTLYGPEQDVALPALGISIPMGEVYLGAENERSDHDADPMRLD